MSFAPGAGGRLKPTALAGKGVRDFLGKPAPPGYIAGLGRGAAGFVTRPDLVPGSALDAPSLPQGRSTTRIANEEDEEALENENEEGLLAARGPLAAEDEEADAIFAAIEAKMAERRKGRRAKAGGDEGKEEDRERRGENGRGNTDSIDPTRLFAQEKMQLRQVTADEWAHIPESGDFIAKRMKKSTIGEKERFTPLPDSILLGSLLHFGGTAGSSASANSSAGAGETNIHETRERVLGARLDMTVGGGETGRTTSIDPIGYLTSLEETTRSTPEINDIRRARLVLRSAVQSNPSNASAWISAVRVEEAAHNLKHARSLIGDALDACPENEDIWLEAIRLAPSLGEKVALATRATVALPAHPTLWIQAANLERDSQAGKRILRRGLEGNPHSGLLWKALIEREEDGEDAHVLLAKAVECCPQDTELWIGLARLEKHQEARKVLNKARQLNPLNVEVWIAAARLEEAHGNQGGLVQKLIPRAMSELTQRGVTINRKEWQQWAIDCERTGDVLTAECITRESALVDLGELDRGDGEDILSTWMEEASRHAKEGYSVVARTLLNCAVERFPGESLAWTQWLALLPEASAEDFDRALTQCPQSIDLWLLYADKRPETRRDVLERALKEIPDSEALWLHLAQYYLQLERPLLEQAIGILKKATQAVLTSERLWRRLIKVARRARASDVPVLIQTALERFPASPKLWIHGIRAGIMDVEQGLAACPRSDELYCLAAERIQNEEGGDLRARAILERARRLLPHSSPIWLASVEVEAKSGSDHLSSSIRAHVQSLLNRALQQVPDCPRLWAEAIRWEPRPTRRSRIMEALRRCGQVPLLLVSLAQLLEGEGNLVGAREHLERAIKSEGGAKDGDVWAAYILFLRRHPHEGTMAAEEVLEQCCEQVRPREGQRWRPFRKQERWWDESPSFRTIFEQFLLESV